MHAYRPHTLFRPVQVRVRRRQTITCTAGTSHPTSMRASPCTAACTATSMKSRMAQQRPHPVFGTGTSNRPPSIQHSPGQTTSPPGSETCLPNQPLDPTSQPSTVACIHHAKSTSPRWNRVHAVLRLPRQAGYPGPSSKDHAFPMRSAEEKATAGTHPPETRRPRRATNELGVTSRARARSIPSSMSVVENDVEWAKRLASSLPWSDRAVSAHRPF